MLSLLPLVPLVCLVGFVVLALGGASLTRRAIAIVAAGAAAISAGLAVVVAAVYLAWPPADYSFSQQLWTWMSVGEFRPQIALYLDPLSLVMMLVVTVVGFLIVLYSTQFMAESEGYSRFFAYMLLFIASMLILVLAKDLLLLYLGWEGVGLCSYLLIGFWYQNSANVRAANKAFIVTRVGDTALALSLFLLFNQLGTLDIQQMMNNARQAWPMGSHYAVAAALLILGGAVGKSAQLPLQTWLPDAMAGPTPVSALIHAATMVTAGVYLIARTNVLFTLAPQVQMLVAIIGAATLIYGSLSALVQHDIKRVLAYSTISQVGYMFMALGVGAWGAGVFHFATHAFFKSLLFLTAGVVIQATGGQHDILQMGGLRKSQPLAFWSALIGAASISALPLVTAGYFSKELILFQAWSIGGAGRWFWLAGTAGAMVTALYIFRVVFMVFLGEQKIQTSKVVGPAMSVPLIILAFLSIVAGYINLPRVAGQPMLIGFLEKVLPAGRPAETTNIAIVVTTTVTSLAGIGLAYALFLRWPGPVKAISQQLSGAAIIRFVQGGWGFDWVYDRLLVRPFVCIAQRGRSDVADWLTHATTTAAVLLNRLASQAQTGNLRWYATGLVLGAVGLIALMVLL